MLFLTTVTKWLGVGRSRRVIDDRIGTNYVFDINNVSNLKQHGIGSKFNYLVSEVNRKTGYDEVYCTTPPSTIKQEFDIPPASSVLELSVFPNNDITKTPFTTYISIYDFCYAWAHNPYPQYSWLVYSVKGSGEKRILINISLLALLQLDYVFDETNIQWYYFVDPEELIHPTWYIRVEEIVEIKHGILYNWYVVNDPRQVTPDGWHIPTNADFLTLQTYLGGEAISGGKLKETGTTYWLAPNIGATNEVDFNGKASGFRSISGWIDNIKQILAMWVINEFDANMAYYTPIINSLAAMSVAGNVTLKKFGCSLRPVKNFTTLTHGQTATYLGNDGKVYRTICIGTQEWLADNLAETKYRDGTTIPEVTDDIIWAGLTTGAVCTFNNDWKNI